MKKILALALLLPVSAFAIVDMKNANFSDTWPDYIGTGDGYVLKIERTYNSRSLLDGMFGFGWCSTFETSVKITPEGNLLFTECGAGLETMYSPRELNFNEVTKTTEQILKAYKKEFPSKPDTAIELFKQNLMSQDALRVQWANKYGLVRKPREGVKYYADGVGVETFIYQNKAFVRQLPNGQKQIFDTNGDLQQISDSNGNHLKFVRKSGLISEVVNNKGAKLSFTYHPNKKVATVKGPKGIVATYTYKNNDLTEVKNSWNNTYKYEYDDLHNLTKILYPDGTFKEISYDKNRDWVLSLTDRSKCTEKYSYTPSKSDPIHHYWSEVVKTCEKKVVHKSKYEFVYKKREDGSTYLSKVKSDINGKDSEVTYHEVLGSPVAIRNGSETFGYAYYSNGLLKSKRAPNFESTFLYLDRTSKVSQVETKYFDTNKKVAKQSKTLFQYDKRGNLAVAKNSDGQIANIKYDSKGRISIITDQAKKVVKINYDNVHGKPNIIERPGLGKIQVVYDIDGNIKDVKSEDGPTVAQQVFSTFNNLLDIIEPATSEQIL